MDFKTISTVQTNSALLARFKVAVQKAAVAILIDGESTQPQVEWAIRANFKLLENRSQEYAQMILGSALIEIAAFGDMLAQLPENEWGTVGTDEQVMDVVNTYVARFVFRDI